MKGPLGRDLETRLSLYLDGRLEKAERAEFERLIESNRDLREAVEFHRGLTLEFHEEAPPLPRGFAERARARLAEARAPEGLGDDSLAPVAGHRRAPGGRAAFGAPVPWWRRSFPLQTACAVAAAALVFALLFPLLREWDEGRGRSVEAPPPSGPPAARSDKDRALADRQTIEALRSLGYIGRGQALPRRETKKPLTRAPRPAPGSPASEDMIGRGREARPAPAERSPASMAKAEVAEKAAPGPQAEASQAPPPQAPVPQTPAPQAAATQAEPPPASPPEAASPQASAAPQATAQEAAAGPSAPAPEAVEFRVLQVAKGPGSAGDGLAIRSAGEWQAFVGDSEGPSTAPAVDFDKEMIVVLRDDLGTDPPSRLRVLAVYQTAGELQIACRAERVEPAAAPPAGQALILPRIDRRIRIVMRP